MNFQKVSGDLNSALGFGEKVSILFQREARTDALELSPLSERKRKLIYPDVASRALNVKQVTPDFSKEWPGLPKGVKFDPSDEELLWHLLAEIGKGVAKRHPFINEFIVYLNDDDGLGIAHPQFLPGVKQDGSMSYFFHRKVELYSSRKLKRKKSHDNSVEICWHSTGKLNLVCVDGIHQGSKEILTLYMNPVNGGNPVKTPWLIHQYLISINGAEEDLVVSKIFYDMRSKQDIQDSRTDSVDGFVEEVVGVAAPLQVEPEFHERLRVEAVSVDASTQISAMLAPAELTMDELSQKDGFQANSDRAPEHVLQKNIFDKMFKTQDKFIATISSEINATGIFSADHVSREKHEAYSQCLDEAHVPLSRISSIAHGKSIGDLFILGLPAYSLKGKLSAATEPKIAIDKNSNSWLNISSQSATPVKIEPKSFEGTGVGVAHEKFSNNRLNASASSGLLIKVKTEHFEEAEEKIIPHFHSKEGTAIYNLSHQACIPEDLCIQSAEILSTRTSDGLDELISETNGLISQHPRKDGSAYDGLLMFNETSQGLLNQHPRKDGDAYDGLLMINETSQVIGNNECYPQINVDVGKPQSDSASSSCSPNVISEPLERSLLNYSQISLCNTREHASLMFVNRRELSSDSSLDILDHVPLRDRLGISISEGDCTVKSGYIGKNFPLTPCCRSCDSVNTKEDIFSCKRQKKTKKTATDSVEKAMEEDVPGLLKLLLDKGIQVEEIKLYGDLEDNDPLETSTFEDSFGELETVMTKLFPERSSFLRCTSGRPVKGSRAVYCLDCLVSLIEQTRYLRFRQTPVDWGWCRDLQSFIFVFQTHNRIVLERPEYGYATYFFELVDTLPVDWQVKRLVKAMKLPNCSRTILLENKPLIVGEDLSEGEARVLESYGWTWDTGFGTLLNYCDRVVHDRRNLLHGSEWRAKIGKMLRSGYDGGRIVLANIPEKVVEYLGSQSSEIKMEL